MKISKTISSLVLVAITIISFSSCTVQYRARHPRRYHHVYNNAPSMNDKPQTVSVAPVASQKNSITR